HHPISLILPASHLIMTLLLIPVSHFTSLSVLPFFFFNAPATPEIYTLSLHDALPISSSRIARLIDIPVTTSITLPATLNPALLRSEEHTSELQSRVDLVCRLLLEKKKKKQYLLKHQQETKRTLKDKTTC